MLGVHSLNLSHSIPEGRKEAFVRERSGRYFWNALILQKLLLVLVIKPAADCPMSDGVTLEVQVIPQGQDLTFWWFPTVLSHLNLSGNKVFYSGICDKILQLFYALTLKFHLLSPDSHSFIFKILIWNQRQTAF